MRSVDRVGGFALILLALGVIWESQKLPLGTIHNPGPGSMPTLLALVLGGLGVVIVAFGGESVALRSLGWTEWKHALAILGACAFAALTLERIGYRLTTLVILLLILGAVERKRPLVVAVLSLALSLGSYYLFHDLLRVQLPRSPWGF
ncbi:MAG: tripartite tricarboxylate transporter TctB family protein [Candidatus Rokubacteria bacterium]|nr:tripartite tricarboxylate transporter TctB family protein [Candidatus Rokubacteria bacterium]